MLCLELHNAWRELAHCEAKNGFIALPKGWRRLSPSVKSKLMVRDCCIELVRIVQERSGLQLPDAAASGDSTGNNAVAAVGHEEEYFGELPRLR